MADVMSMEEIHATVECLGIDLSSFNLDSIRLPPGDDLGIISDDEDLKRGKSLEFEEGFGNIIVVHNLPVVPKEKFNKLEKVVHKIYRK
ncbi:eukaryotic translation initiation factor 3 subunit B-like [Henckelia pumila]|uniref:eukaryotic translation initiation factor 3 subunit B-like n=1 Tax=Henckelia pumila TaxID=405737 RepID=UPI003C6E4FC6